MVIQSGRKWSEGETGGEGHWVGASAKYYQRVGNAGILGGAGRMWTGIRTSEVSSWSLGDRQGRKKGERQAVVRRESSKSREQTVRGM